MNTTLRIAENGRQQVSTYGNWFTCRRPPGLRRTGQRAANIDERNQECLAASHGIEAGQIGAIQQQAENEY